MKKHKVFTSLKSVCLIIAWVLTIPSVFYFTVGCLFAGQICKEIDGADLSKSDVDYLKEFAFGEITDYIEILNVHALKDLNLYPSLEYNCVYVDFKVHDLSILRRASSKLGYDYIHGESKNIKDIYSVSFEKRYEDNLHRYYEMRVYLHHYNKKENPNIVRISSPHQKVECNTFAGFIPILYVIPLFFGAPLLFLLLAGLFKLLECKMSKNTLIDKKE